MKKLIIISAATIALVGCNKAEQASNETAAPAAENAATPEAAPAAMVTANGSEPGTYDVTAKDGTKSQTMLNADGTYHDMDASGKETAHGTWNVTDGKTCFSPAGGTGPECFTETPVGADGSFTATSDKGESVTVKKAG